MRILTLSDCPLVRHQGSGYVILGFHDQLQTRGWQIELVGPDELLWPRRFGTKGRQYRITLGMARRALAAHRAGSADLVLAYGEECWLAFRLLSRRKGRPRLVHHSNGLRAHMAYWHGTPKSRWRPDTSDALRRADHVVVVSQFERAFALARYGLPADRVTLIVNPAKAVAPPGPTERQDEVLFVGGWTPNKGIREMTLALPGFLERHPDWSFRIVGADDPSAVRAAFPAALGERVTVEGVIRDREEVARRMASARLLLLPSHYESYGLVVAEGILQGAVPVTTTVGLGAELTDGTDGFVFPPRDAQALSDALDRASSASSRLPAIADRARMLVVDRTWDRAGEQMDMLLRGLLTR